MKAELLFVYGTLYPDLAPGTLKAMCSNFCSQGTIEVEGVLLDMGSYPGLVINPGLVVGASEDQLKRLEKVWKLLNFSPYKVHGELFKVEGTDDFWASLDEYEDCHPEAEQSLYFRVKIKVKSDPGFEGAWVYVLTKLPSKIRVIESGDYRAYIGL